MKCNINGCENEASKDISRLGKTALCDRHLAIKEAQRINVPSKAPMWNQCDNEPLTATEILRRQQEHDDRLQSDIQAMQQRRSPLLDDLVAKAVATGAFSTEMQQGNKRADRNQFAAPRRDGAVLELTREQYHSMIVEIMYVTSTFNPSRFADLQALLKSYGIVKEAE